jgi:hypothetical protein
MKLILFASLLSSIFRSPDETDNGGGSQPQAVDYEKIYTGTLNEAGLDSLTRLTRGDFAVGLVYQVAERVGNGKDGPVYVLRTKEVTGKNLTQEQYEFINAVEGRKAFQGGPDTGEEVLKASPYTGSTGQRTDDGTSITQAKTTNADFVQNDGGDGEIANNTTNQIQAEQIAHTIHQTTEANPLETSQYESQPEMTVAKTTNEDFVQDDSKLGEKDPANGQQVQTDEQVQQGETGKESQPPVSEKSITGEEGKLNSPAETSNTASEGDQDSGKGKAPEKEGSSKKAANEGKKATAEKAAPKKAAEKKPAAKKAAPKKQSKK